ncbi:MAG TPA: (d)CMP kinase, partial [Solirubrobacteraceae bacterium]
ADVDTVLRDQTLRDQRDQSGDRSVLTAAPGAVEVDTTGMSLDEVVEQIVTLAVEAREIEA